MDDHPVHITPNHHPPNIDVLPKSLVQISLAAKQLVRHSSTSPNKRRQPLPSLLYKSFFYDEDANISHAFILVPCILVYSTVDILIMDEVRLSHSLASCMR